MCWMPVDTPGFTILQEVLGSGVWALPEVDTAAVNEWPPEPF